MTAAINSTGAGKRGYPTKSSVPLTQASTQRRARERSVAIQTLLLVRKSKSSSVRSEERFSRNAETDLVCRLLLEKKKKSHAARKPLHSPEQPRCGCPGTRHSRHPSLPA